MKVYACDEHLKLFNFNERENATTVKSTHEEEKKQQPLLEQPDELSETSQLGLDSSLDNDYHS